MGARNLLEAVASLLLLFAKIFLCLILAAGDRLAGRLGASGRIDGAGDRPRRPAAEAP